MAIFRHLQVCKCKIHGLQGTILEIRTPRPLIFPQVKTAVKVCNEEIFCTICYSEAGHFTHLQCPKNHPYHQECIQICQWKYSKHIEHTCLICGLPLEAQESTWIRISADLYESLRKQYTLPELLVRGINDTQVTKISDFLSCEYNYHIEILNIIPFSWCPIFRTRRSLAKAVGTVLLEREVDVHNKIAYLYYAAEYLDINFYVQFATKCYAPWMICG